MPQDSIAILTYCGAKCAQEIGLGSVIYRCPMTGANVQGWAPDEMRVDATEDDFISLACPACRQTHLVNVTTGRVLGGSNDTNDKWQPDDDKERK